MGRFMVRFMYCAVYIRMRIGTANCRSHPLWPKKHVHKEQIGDRLSSQSSSTWLLSLRRVFGPSSTSWIMYGCDLTVWRVQYICADSQSIIITTTVRVVFVLFGSRYITAYVRLHGIFGYGPNCWHPHFWVIATSLWVSCFLRPRSGWTLKVLEELMDQSVSNFPEMKVRGVMQHSQTQYMRIYIYGTPPSKVYLFHGQKEVPYIYIYILYFDVLEI